MFHRDAHRGPTIRGRIPRATRACGLRTGRVAGSKPVSHPWASGSPSAPTMPDPPLVTGPRWRSTLLIVEHAAAPAELVESVEERSCEREHRVVVVAER